MDINWDKEISHYDMEDLYYHICPINSSHTNMNTVVEIFTESVKLTKIRSL